MRQIKFDKRSYVSYCSLNESLDRIISSFIEQWKRRSKTSSRRIIFLTDVVFKKGTTEETIEYIKTCEHSIGMIPATFIVIRNNNTDPALFKEVMDFNKVVLVPDYTIVNAGGINVLCIGGRITPNRSWKMSNIKRKNVCYFEDEAPVFNEEAINEICEDKGTNIQMLVTATPLTYTGDNIEVMLGNWASKDKNLFNDIMASRLIMDEIMIRLRKAGKTPSVWCMPSNNGSERVALGETVFVSNVSVLDDMRDYVSEHPQSIRRRKKPLSFDNAMYGRLHHIEPMELRPIVNEPFVPDVPNEVGEDDDAADEIMSESENNIVETTATSEAEDNTSFAFEYFTHPNLNHAARVGTVVEQIPAEASPNRGYHTTNNTDGAHRIDIPTANYARVFTNAAGDMVVDQEFYNRYVNITNGRQ